MSFGSSGSSDEIDRLVQLEPWLRLLLRHLAGRRVLARVEIDDVVQEVYLRALAPGVTIPDLAAGPLALRRYLARLARHVVIDIARAWRARKRRGVELALVRSDWSVAGVPVSALADPAAGPRTRLGASEESERLARSFETLSGEHRRVIGLRQLEGLSAEETAKRMGRSATAVHSLYRRALAAWSEAAGRSGISR